MKIYSAFKRPPVEGIVFTEPTMTQQQFRDESDINWIMQRFAKTGELPNTNRSYYYGDGSPLDYQQALDTINEAEEQFLTFPSSIRDRFENNPSKLLEFLHNPANREEGVKLGLFKVPAPASPAPASPAPASPAENVKNSTG